MNADVLRNAGFDYDRGVKRFLGRTAIYEKTLTKFLRDGTFARIRAAHEEGDPAQLLAHVHEFKGMCGNIALASLSEAAVRLVALLREADDAAAVDTAYTLLEKEYCGACETIRSALEGQS